jgi:hypothetical protein
VPRSYEVHDSETVKQLAGELDFSENFELAEGATVELGLKLSTVLQQHQDQLRA